MLAKELLMRAGRSRSRLTSVGQSTKLVQGEDKLIKLIERITSVDERRVSSVKSRTSQD
jgi:hypothetical protein